MKKTQTNKPFQRNNKTKNKATTTTRQHTHNKRTCGSMFPCNLECLIFFESNLCDIQLHDFEVLQNTMHLRPRDLFKNDTIFVSASSK